MTRKHLNFVSKRNSLEKDLGCLLINFAIAGNERIAFKFHDVHGDEVPSYIPLGMTIDDEGFLWVATYYGGTVLKIDPRFF